MLTTISIGACAAAEDGAAAWAARAAIRRAWALRWSADTGRSLSQRGRPPCDALRACRGVESAGAGRARLATAPGCANTRDPHGRFHPSPAARLPAVA